MSEVPLYDLQDSSDPALPLKVQAEPSQAHVETLIIHKLGFNQNYYTFALISLIKIVLCSEFH